MIEITNENFENEVKNAQTPVLLDFWADWCGPCRMLSPVVEQLSAQYEGKVKFGKVNVDQQQQLATRYGIRSIPTLMLFKGGEAVNSSVGVVPKEQIESMLG